MYNEKDKAIYLDIKQENALFRLLHKQNNLDPELESLVREIESKIYERLTIEEINRLIGK